MRLAADAPCYPPAPRLVNNAAQQTPCKHLLPLLILSCSCPSLSPFPFSSVGLSPHPPPLTSRQLLLHPQHSTLDVPFPIATSANFHPSVLTPLNPRPRASDALSHGDCREPGNPARAPPLYKRPAHRPQGPRRPAVHAPQAQENRHGFRPWRDQERRGEHPRAAARRMAQICTYIMIFLLPVHITMIWGVARRASRIAGERAVEPCGTRPAD